MWFMLGVEFQDGASAVKALEEIGRWSEQIPVRKGGCRGSEGVQAYVHGWRIWLSAGSGEMDTVMLNYVPHLAPFARWMHNLFLRTADITKLVAAIRGAGNDHILELSMSDVAMIANQTLEKPHDDRYLDDSFNLAILRACLENYRLRKDNRTLTQERSRLLRSRQTLRRTLNRVRAAVGVKRKGAQPTAV